MRRRGRQTTWGFSVVDLLASLAITFLVLSLTISDSPARPVTPGVAVGLMTVELTWSLADNADVDLWVKSPDDEAVGFRRMHGKHFDLIRDDLGRFLDPDSRNLEMAVARDIPPGEVIINSMLYTSYDNRLPVPVKVTVRYGDKQVLTATGSLSYNGQEITMLRLLVSKDGKVTVEPNLYTPLYSGSPE